MYITPIRLDLLLNTNQISCCEGKWHVSRFDPDTVEDGPYLSVCNRGGSIQCLDAGDHATNNSTAWLVLPDLLIKKCAYQTSL